MVSIILSLATANSSSILYVGRAPSCLAVLFTLGNPVARETMHCVRYASPRRKSKQTICYVKSAPQEGLILFIYCGLPEGRI